MQPTSASASTIGVPSQRSGGVTAMGFKGRRFGATRPPKFQPLGGKGNNGTKRSK